MNQKKSAAVLEIQSFPFGVPRETARPKKNSTVDFRFFLHEVIWISFLKKKECLLEPGLPPNGQPSGKEWPRFLLASRAVESRGHRRKKPSLQHPYLRPSLTRTFWHSPPARKKRRPNLSPPTPFPPPPPRTLTLTIIPSQPGSWDCWLLRTIMTILCKEESLTETIWLRQMTHWRSFCSLSCTRRRGRKRLVEKAVVVFPLQLPRYTPSSTQFSNTIFLMMKKQKPETRLLHAHLR